MNGAQIHSGDGVPESVARQVGGRRQIGIRAARPADADVIRRLALLVDRAVPAAPLLIAESDGAVVAALSATTGAVVSDPFRATADLVELLRLRSAQLHALAA
jgi:hypothetical protein